MIQAKCIQESINDNPWLEHDLEVGKFYEVKKIEVGHWYTDVYINGRSYNSVYLEFYEDGKPLNIFKDERFNPYIKR